MNTKFFAVSALSVVVAAGSAWGADDATSRCQQLAQEDGVSVEDMNEYIEQCLEDQRMAAAEIDPPAEGKTDSTSEQSD